MPEDRGALRNGVDPAAMRDLRAAVAARVESDIEALGDSMLAGYQKEIAAYAAIDDPSTLAEVRAGTRMNLAVLLGAMREGARLNRRQTALLKEIGHRRAAQGFPLHAVLRAYQVGTRITWEWLLNAVTCEAADPVVSAALVAEFSTAILGIMGQLSNTVTTAYLETERATAAAEERSRHDVFSELLSGPVDAGAPLRERAERVGIRLGDAHAVAVVAADGDGAAVLLRGAS
ncbi:MAG: hypothetical protein ACRDJM_02260, partial [Actinomycetota bacterium]